ncbi:MAG: type I polyketide synthase, partial [Halieaceae bacterium]|nr:type I polyketide synthase [Halieaceae bacterium]
VQGVLGAPVGDEEPLMAAGLDSLGAVELRNTLESSLGMQLPGTLVFDYPTTNAIQDFICSTFAADELAVATEVADAGHVPAGSIREANIESAASWSELSGLGSVRPVDTIGCVPYQRWDDPSALAEGRHAQFGSFMSGVGMFDPVVFGITRTEAELMDPQQSCMLETACSIRSKMPDSAVDKFGVFVGVAPSGYNIDLLKHTSPGPFHGMAMGTSVVCGRVSFIFGFRGPSVCIDTACSSSLVGLHLGLARGEVYNMVSGVHIMPNGTSTSYLLSAGMLTEDGRCKTLDAKADGYVRAEACCSVLLAPLSEANGTTKKAAVRLRGSAVNQDGRSSSLTAPNGPSQQQVMLASLKRAGTSPASVTVLEMHGTGTPLGDPIEVGAAGAVLWTDRRAPLVWAAAKSAVGHA